MRLPIITSCDGDIRLFHSVGEVESYAEPIDIRNGEYVIYDADGMLLNPVIIQERPYEEVRIRPTNELRRDELRELLVEFFSEVGHEKSVLETMNLAQLIEIGKAYWKPIT